MSESDAYQPANAIEALLLTIRRIGVDAAIAQFDSELLDAEVSAAEIAGFHGVLNRACSAVLRRKKAEMAEVSCDFCQRPQAEVFWLVQGPLSAICDACVETAAAYVEAANDAKRSPFMRMLRRSFRRQRRPRFPQKEER